MTTPENQFALCVRPNCCRDLKLKISNQLEAFKILNSLNVTLSPAVLIDTLEKIVSSEIGAQSIPHAFTHSLVVSPPNTSQEDKTTKVAKKLEPDVGRRDDRKVVPKMGWRKKRRGKLSSHTKNRKTMALRSKKCQVKLEEDQVRRKFEEISESELTTEEESAGEELVPISKAFTKSVKNIDMPKQDKKRQKLRVQLVHHHRVTREKERRVFRKKGKKKVTGDKWPLKKKPKSKSSSSGTLKVSSKNSYGKNRKNKGRHNGNQKASTKKVKSKIGKISKPSKKMSHECLECGKQFMSQSSTSYHVRRVHFRENRKKCPDCHEDFSNNQNLGRHWNRFHGGGTV